MLYLLFDLVIFEGPIKTQTRRMQGAPVGDVSADQERGIVARVFTKPILLSQVDYAVDERLWRTGRTREQISKQERLNLRKVAVRELCDHALLREKVALNTKEFPVTDEEINAAMLRFASRFTTKDDLAKAMTNFGFEGEKELRFRIAARLQQNKYLDFHIARGIAVSDDEALAWYHDHKETATIPERIKVRHIFLAANGHSEEAARVSLSKLKTQLTEGASFANLAQQFSEDEHSKKLGGDLGWMTRSRVSKDFSEATFKLTTNEPQIITTKIGYHLVEVTEKAAAQLRSFDEMKPEIVSALETSRRKEAVRIYRQNLTHQHPGKVIIHESMLSDDWTN